MSKLLVLLSFMGGKPGEGKDTKIQDKQKKQIFTKTKASYFAKSFVETKNLL